MALQSALIRMQEAAAVMQVEVQPKHVAPGSTISICVSGYDGPKERANFQVDFYYVELDRDHLSLSIGIEAELCEQFTLNIKVPEGARHAPHVLRRLGAISLSDATDQGERNLLVGRIDFDGICCEVSVAPNVTHPDEIVATIHGQRERRIRRRLEVGAPPHSITAGVMYLYSGLLVHGPQHGEGYSILPFGDGLSPASYEAAVNAFCNSTMGIAFEVTSQQASEFKSQQPMAAIAFHSIAAQNIETAREGTRQLAEDIALALAFDKGHAPSPFACIVGQWREVTMWLLHHPYPGNLDPGNLASPFGATKQGAEVERLTAAMSKSPCAKLLLELHVQAVGDRDPMFEVFRHWSILELLAKRAVPGNQHHIYDASGQRILLSNGQPVTTSKAEAKVYKYLIEQGAPGLQCTTSTARGSFKAAIHGSTPHPPVPADLEMTYWEFIRAAYAVRNGIAHEGRFELDANADPNSGEGLAFALLSSPAPGLLYDHIKAQSRLAVLRELQRL